jgi:hypothetical protein
MAGYCSVTCQKAHWKVHKRDALCLRGTDETRRIFRTAQVLPGSCGLGFGNTTVTLVRKTAPNDRSVQVQCFSQTDSIFEVWRIATACKNAVFPGDVAAAELEPLNWSRCRIGAKFADVGEELTGLAEEEFRNFEGLRASNFSGDSIVVVHEEEMDRSELYGMAMAVLALLERARALQAEIQNCGGITPQVFFCWEPVPMEYVAHQVQEVVGIPPFSGFCLFPVSLGLGPVTPK